MNQSIYYNCRRLILAASSGDKEEIVKILLTRAVDINYTTEHGYTALMLAAYKGYPEIVNLLLVAGAIIDLANVEGNTALMLSEDWQVTKLLLVAGADTTLVNKYYITALMRARFLMRDKHIINTLVLYGCKKLEMYIGIMPSDVVKIIADFM